MIKSDIFYTRFDQGFEAAVPLLPIRRLKGKVSKYELASSSGPVQLLFQVNSKASAMPYAPGQFWPVITAPASLRSGEPSDDGTISWYQYTSDAANQEVQALQRRVYEKVASQDAFSHELYRDLRDQSLEMMRTSIESPLEPRFPSTPLHYLDGDDAQAWGALFAAQLPDWLARFQAGPETLDRYMWRVHWAHL
jgi:hypothetical protein